MWYSSISARLWLRYSVCGVMLTAESQPCWYSAHLLVATRATTIVPLSPDYPSWALPIANSVVKINTINKYLPHGSHRSRFYHFNSHKRIYCDWMLVFLCGMLVFFILWHSETLMYKEVQFNKSKTYTELSKKAHSELQVNPSDINPPCRSCIVTSSFFLQVK